MKRRPFGSGGNGAARPRMVRTLIVDDSAFVVRSLISFFGQQRGFEVVGVAETGEEAVEQVGELMPDLVLMDVHMPRVNGLEATRRIKMRKNPPVVIMFTLEDSGAVQAAARAAGVDEFVAKAPKGWNALVAAIRRAFPDGDERR